MSFRPTTLKKLALSSSAMLMAGMVISTPAVASATPSSTVAVGVESESTDAQAAAPQGEEPENVQSEQPNNNDHEGLWVPDWLLLVVAGLVIAAAVAVATQSYLRFTQARRELEG